MHRSFSHERSRQSSQLARPSSSSRPSTFLCNFNAGTRLRRWSGSLLSDSIHLQLLGCVSRLPATRP